MDVPDYLVPGETSQDRVENKRYWDVVLRDMISGDYTKFCKMLKQLAKLSLAFRPNTPAEKARHRDFRDKVDVSFLHQQFTHNLFGLLEFTNLFSYWIDWVKPLGSVADETVLDDLKEYVVTTATSKGYMYVLPYCYDRLYRFLTTTIETVYALQQGIKN